MVGEEGGRLEKHVTGVTLAFFFIAKVVCPEFLLLRVKAQAWGKRKNNFLSSAFNKV
jgi:hypothetical protein